MAELKRLPGEEERRGCSSCGFGVELHSLLLPPLSISSLSPPGTHALARPQELGSQDQAKRGEKGEQEREGWITQKKEKNRAYLMKMYCQALPVRCSSKVLRFQKQLTLLKFFLLPDIVAVTLFMHHIFDKGQKYSLIYFCFALIQVSL